MDRMQRELVAREPRSQLARVIGRAVIEMPARAKQFDRGKFRARRFSQQGRRKFSIYEKVRGKHALHGHDVRALFMEVVSTLCEPGRRVKTGSDKRRID